jgi:hypothetical protein
MAHDQLKKWGKGVSGNPAGRPKAYIEMTKLARSHTTEALEKLVELMRDKRNKGIALKATEILLDRGWGKCPLAIVGEGGEGPVKISVSWQHTDDAEKVALVDITPNIPLLEAAGDD